MTSFRLTTHNSRTSRVIGSIMFTPCSRETEVYAPEAAISGHASFLSCASVCRAVSGNSQRISVTSFRLEYHNSRTSGDIGSTFFSSRRREMGENASAATFPGDPPFSSCTRWYAGEHEKITLSLSTCVEKSSHNSRSTRDVFVIFFLACRVVGDLPSSRWRRSNFGVGRWRFWVGSCRLWEAVSRKVYEISKFGLRRSIRLVALCNPDFFRVVLRLSHFRRKRKAITLEFFLRYLEMF